MAYRIPSTPKTSFDHLALPSPAELCRTPLAIRYKLQQVEGLQPSEWDEIPTRPIRRAALDLLDA